VSAKPTLLLLPGTLCDARMFSAQRRMLRTARVCSRIVCASYAGMKDRDTWLAGLLRSLPERFHVAGFSLGGLFALELLRLAPERVAGLALIASNAQAGGALAKRRSGWLRKLWQSRGVAEVARHVKPKYFHHEARRRAHEHLVFDMALSTPRRAAFEEFAWAASRPAGFEALQHFDKPLMLVSGARDKLCPPAWQRAVVRAQPRTQWHELARVGHFIPLEAPAQLGFHLIHWLKQPSAHIPYGQHATNSGAFDVHQHIVTPRQLVSV
jgi:pimeloyl-ACP methyl ester carboxylesterase